MRPPGGGEPALRIALINPRFDVSYWGHDYVMPIVGKRANTPVAALPLLAALTPDSHAVTLIDENIEPIDYEAVAGMDIVGVTGMSVQRVRMKEILRELKKHGCFTVVGGPWVTVQEDYFGELADVIFVGEAEDTWPVFLKDWQEGQWNRRYEQQTKSDMTRVPTPRFDLLHMNKYLYASIQISRGCPFTCEFCDIIVTFGRLPRLKTSAQVLAELESLRVLKVQQVFIVDDNLIGNKQAIKGVLRDIVQYQERHGYPFRFFTEATLDLAEDDELMHLMADAHIEAIFIGIETPNEASLKETKKHQNVRPGAGSMLERIGRIQRVGIEVTCGMIVGFDHDDAGIFQAQRQFLTDGHIPHAMVGMLYAIPKTPLYDRLAKEGRLDPADESEFGTNVIPLNLSRDQLRDGYIGVMHALYEPAAFFERVETLYFGGHLGHGQLGKDKYEKQHPWARVKNAITQTVIAIVLACRLFLYVKEKGLRSEYGQRVCRALTEGVSARFMTEYLYTCAMHYHYYKLVQGLREGRLVSTL
ncbi:MAG: B12-binding domain-containing radical SAM protein [Nitrospira sp.]